jgi:hypothetical protein
MRKHKIFLIILLIECIICLVQFDKKLSHASGREEFGEAISVWGR